MLYCIQNQLLLLQLLSALGLIGLLGSPFFFPGILYGLPRIPDSILKKKSNNGCWAKPKHRESRREGWGERREGWGVRSEERGVSAWRLNDVNYYIPETSPSLRRREGDQGGEFMKNSGEKKGWVHEDMSEAEAPWVHEDNSNLLQRLVRKPWFLFI